MRCLCSHFGCNVFHESLVLRNDVDAEVWSSVFVSSLQHATSFKFFLVAQEVKKKIKKFIDRTMAEVHERQCMQIMQVSMCSLVR